MFGFGEIFLTIFTLIINSYTLIKYKGFLPLQTLHLSRLSPQLFHAIKHRQKQARKHDEILKSNRRQTYSTLALASVYLYSLIPLCGLFHLRTSAEFTSTLCSFIFYLSSSIRLVNNQFILIFILYLNLINK